MQYKSKYPTIYDIFQVTWENLEDIGNAINDFTLTVVFETTKIKPYIITHSYNTEVKIPFGAYFIYNRNTKEIQYCDDMSQIKAMYEPI